MKKNWNSMLLLTGVSFILFTGFKKSDSIVFSTAKHNATVSKAVTSAVPTPVAIYCTFPGGTFPNVTGTFTASGGLSTSGNCTMDISVQGYTAHCVVVLQPSSGGTITIHQQCQFATNPATGRWEIVSGTGTYANLKGNGSLLMPNDDEDMVGVIH